MIASGVQSTAKGMAPSADLRAFDWNSDEAEMASEAANGALVSNHSYGYGRGWVWTGTAWSWYGNTSISTQEDYLFGFYDSQAQDWDQIVLEDSEIIALVNLRVLSEEVGVSPLQVLMSQEEAGSFVAGFASLLGTGPLR